MPTRKLAKPEPRVARWMSYWPRKRLEQRGRELIEQVKALAPEVAEAKAKSEDAQGRRK